MKPQLCSRLCLILKRLDENCSRCNLKLLYIIYQYFKISNIYQKFMRPSNLAQAVMLVYYRKAPHDLKRLNESRRRSCVYNLQYNIPLFQKFHNSPIQKRSDGLKKQNPGRGYNTSFLYELENYPIKTLGEDAFSCYYISLNYFKISKIPKVQK